MTTKRLIGSAPSQVSRNRDLGTMAFQESSQYYSLTQQPTFRNRIINGDMRIDQRNSGAVVSRLGNDSTVAYPVDKIFVYNNTGTSNVTVYGQQVSVSDTSVPFDQAVRMTVGNTSNRTSYDGRFQHNIEGNNVYDFKVNGTGAHPITVTFWARASKEAKVVYSFWASNAGTGAYFYEWVDLTTSWKKYTIVIPACNISGAEILRNTGRGFGTGIYWALGYFGNNQTQKLGRWFSGSELNSQLSNFDNFSASGDWIEFTGYQVEKGSVATPFEFRPYTTELALCQRYYENSWFPASSPAQVGGAYYNSVNYKQTVTTNDVIQSVPYKVTKRGIPSVSIYNPQTGTINQVYKTTNGVGSNISVQGALTSAYNLSYVNTTSNITAGDYVYFHFEAAVDV